MKKTVFNKSVDIVVSCKSGKVFTATISYEEARKLWEELNEEFSYPPPTVTPPSFNDSRPLSNGNMWEIQINPSIWYTI